MSLSLAKTAGVLYEDLCFHAQQASEKAIKAVYRSARKGFRYTHDIGELLNGLGGLGIHVPETIREAARLSKFA